MKKASVLFILMSMATVTVILISGSETIAGTAPDMIPGTMMLEHQNMGCKNCHGENGPKGTDMKNHPGQQCNDCHEKGARKVRKATKPRVAEGEAPPLGPMMLEHKDMGCGNCHGDNGPEGVDMKNHPGQSCTDCHKLMK